MTRVFQTPRLPVCAAVTPTAAERYCATDDGVTMPPELTCSCRCWANALAPAANADGSAGVKPLRPSSGWIDARPRMLMTWPPTLLVGDCHASGLPVR